MAQLRDIQLCELEILKEIDRICRKHRIPYWLAYGTMLGAVRHKGFIPWDDDLDIYMRFQDFKRFQSICKTELGDSYFLQTPLSEPSMPWMIYKVRKNGTKMMQTGQVFNSTFNFGIWVDIFPLVNFAEEEADQKKQFDTLKKLQALRYKCPRIRHDNSLKDVIRKMVVSIIHLKESRLWSKVCRLGNGKSRQQLVVSHLIVQEYGLAHRDEILYDSSMFEKSSLYEFEGDLFPGINDYNSYLTQCYGETYMTPRKSAGHTVDYESVLL